MTVTSINEDFEPSFFSAEDSLRPVAELLKERGTKIEFHQNKGSYWQVVFLQSQANGCAYRGEDLPHLRWQWPTNTWFQSQLRRQLKAIGLSAPQVRI